MTFFRKLYLCCYEKGFTFDPNNFISQGGTVTFVALQLAFYMGFKNVSLVGCDHRYDFSGKPHEQLVGTQIDKNHFSTSYFSNLHWNAPDLEMSEYSYKVALDAFEKNERSLYNSSTVTSLDTLPKLPLQDFLNL